MIATMFDTAAIFRREFVARWDLLWAALYIAVLVAVVPLAPFIPSIERADVRDLMSVGSALAAGLALSIGLGATFFGRDLSEGRLGFYFERPVRSVAVWLGRFLAVLTLVVLFEAVTLLPAWLSSSEGLMIMSYVGWPESFGAVEWTVTLVAGPAFLMLLAHAVSVMVRARTAWLFLDVIGCVATLIVAWLCVRPFVVEDFEDALLVVGLALAASVFLALLAGFAAGVHSGRCDLGRVHRVLSVTLWGTMAITFGAAAVYGEWLRIFEPTDLSYFEVGRVSLNGEWAEVKGTARWRQDVERRFLISTMDSRWLRLPSRSGGWRWSVSFSEDGSRVQWFDIDRGEEVGFLAYADLDEGTLEPVITSIMMNSDSYDYLSPSGRRLAVTDDRVLSVYDFDGEQLLTAVRLPDEFQGSRPVFVNDSTIRLYRRSGEPGDWTMSIAEVDVRAGTVNHTGSFAIGSEYAGSAFDANLRYMVVRTRRDEYDYYPRIGNIIDARTGAFIRPITDFAAFLHDGRVLKIVREGDDPKSVVVEDPTGENRVELDLPDVRDLTIIGEGQAGHLLLAHSSDITSPYRSDQIDLFNLETGTTQNIAKGLRPDSGYRWAYGQGWYRGGPAGQRLFWKGRRILVRWDSNKAELVPVVVGREGG
jgi:hypothetical protein